MKELINILSFLKIKVCPKLFLYELIEEVLSFHLVYNIV